MIKKVLKVGAIVLVLSVASGCASQAAIDAAQATDRQRSKRCSSS